MTANDDARVRAVLGRPVDNLKIPSLIFVDGVGFRAARVQLARSLTVERSGVTLCLHHLIAGFERTELSYDIRGLPAPAKPMAEDTETISLHTTLIADGYKESAHAQGWPRRFGSNFAQTVSLPALPPATRRVELVIEVEHLGAWRLATELVQAEGPGRVDITGTAERDGVTIQVTAIATDARTTAIELEVVRPKGVAHVRGIGGLFGFRRDASALILRDEHGRIYPERFRPVRALREDERDYAVFPPLASDAHDLELEVPTIFLEEGGRRAELDLERLPITCRLGPYSLTVVGRQLTSIQEGEAPARPMTELSVETGGWVGSRRLIAPWEGFADGNPTALSFIGGMRASAPEPVRRLLLDHALAGPNPRRLVLQHLLVEVRGLWRIPVKRPPSAALPD